MILVNISGPTSSGKSDLAIDLAKVLGSERCWIISTDSRQIYRGLDIGTGKVEGSWHNQVFYYQEVKHFLIDYVDPKLEYSLANYLQDFCNLFDVKNNYLLTNRKLELPKYVILVGGTGLYSRAILQEFQPGILRSEFEGEFSTEKAFLQSLDLSNLQVFYSDLNLPALNNSDWHNPRRLVAKILKFQGGRRGWFDTLQYPDFEQKYSFTLSLDFSYLKSKIRRRLGARLSSGMIQEVERLQNLGLSFSRFWNLGLEYRAVICYLYGLLDLPEMYVFLEREILRYAKRQLVWLQKEKAKSIASLSDILDQLKQG